MKDLSISTHVTDHNFVEEGEPCGTCNFSGAYEQSDHQEGKGVVQGGHPSSILLKIQKQKKCKYTHSD